MPVLDPDAPVLLIRLDNNELTSIPVEIGDLSRLLVFGVERNQLTSVPTQLGHLPNLRVLRLAANQLTSIPMTLNGLDSLQTLTLSNNQLTGNIALPLVGLIDTLTSITIADGTGGNDCLTSSDPAVTAFLNANAEDWDLCEN